MCQLANSADIATLVDFMTECVVAGPEDDFTTFMLQYMILHSSEICKGAKSLSSLSLIQ